MATLTYDPSETKEGELTEEEQNSLEVGEKMQAEQEQLLAGKFKNAEDLEKSYIELQKKLGSQEKETEETVTETTDEKVEEKEEKEEEVDTSFLNTLWEEATSGKDFTKETLDKLSGLDSREIAQMYLKDRADNPVEDKPEFTEESVSDLKNIVGGEEPYKDMMAWATQNLSKKEVQMYDAVMDNGDPLAAFFAVQALTYRFNDAKGVDGEMLQGKAAKSEGDVFKSQAQVVKAMSDPQYDKDPAYRQAIYDKLERSNIEF